MRARIPCVRTEFGAIMILMTMIEVDMMISASVAALDGGRRAGRSSVEAYYHSADLLLLAFGDVGDGRALIFDATRASAARSPRRRAPRRYAAIG